MVIKFGCVVQLVEHCTFNAGVRGSSPLTPTKKIKKFLKKDLTNNQKCDIIIMVRGMGADRLPTL